MVREIGLQSPLDSVVRGVIQDGVGNGDHQGRNESAVERADALSVIGCKRDYALHPDVLRCRKSALEQLWDVLHRLALVLVVRKEQRNHVNDLLAFLEGELRLFLISII